MIILLYYTNKQPIGLKTSNFLDHVREIIRLHHLSYSTEKSYVAWIYRFILFHNKKQPAEMIT